ncbi:MAG: hypothetical protein AVDCRST_MAG71-2861 [uncultured Lysobacter sp.]|uniref:Uncharacterized protein n=1 Tax=uncultured Lysobacter sp. TaxID=271060 RepID=A0A6J4MAT9_9GAMM|nr:MAG: hypothetical protein AVDCRST_MAG71-2861 [uncultured Lysobacter sp.]
MSDGNGYAVYFHPQALEVLGDAIKAYLLEGPTGPHVACREVDTGGSFVEMTLDGRDAQGQRVDLELIVPLNMVRMIVSARSEDRFGFAPRAAVPVEPALPPVGPTGAPVEAPSEAVPDTGSVGDAPVQTPGKP